MAKYNVAGDAFVVTSEMKLADLKAIKKYRPKALTLFEEEKPVFTISTEGSPGITKFGATFAEESRDGSGKACITMLLAYDGDNIKEHIAEEIGAQLMNINKIERNLPAVLEEINSERNAILNQITVQ